MGSVKDLKILARATEQSLGIGRFVFSDRYSVFDWGEMPDQIPHKGSAIALLGAYFFERLEERGIPTHYVGLLEEENVKKLSELKTPANTMEVKLLRVIRPEAQGDRYDYSIYQREKSGFLLPLEVICRNFLPEGSSVFRRLKNGEIEPAYLGLDRPPVPGQKLDPPFVDASTKLEATDRYLTWDEATQISGLSEEEIVQVKILASTINTLITEEFATRGLTAEDGKIELGFDMERRLIVVDVLGTLDECRFTYEGLPVSKEIARIYYRDSEWYRVVEEAKKKDARHWKDLCPLNPNPLPERLKRAISQIYCACTNEITRHVWFKDIPPLNHILKDIKEMLPL